MPKATSSLLANVCSEAATLDFGFPCLKELAHNAGAEQTATVWPHQTGPELAPFLAKAQQCHVSSPTTCGDAGAAPARTSAANPVFPSETPG